MPRAAVLYEFDTPLVIEEIEVDPPRSGEVMVRLAAARGPTGPHFDQT
ncbi:MAG: hypothetical protein ACYCUG_18225 [Acidimicrobiales bacterium]